MIANVKTFFKFFFPVQLLLHFLLGKEESFEEKRLAEWGLTVTRGIGVSRERRGSRSAGRKQREELLALLLNREEASEEERRVKGIHESQGGEPERWQEARSRVNR